MEIQSQECTRPTLETARLVLRPLFQSDAARIQALAGNKAIAAMTGTIPHPYPLEAATSWIATHEEKFRKGTAAEFGIVLRATNELIGCIALGVFKAHQKAELGYWIGVDHWGQGYCSEAAVEVVRYGFEQLGLNKVTSRHMTSNPASGRVMMKAGLKPEGILVQDLLKDGVFHDMAVYGLVRGEWSRLRSIPSE